ncbi:zinc finger protein 543-like [Melanerpes formicivorus]|uniref:zinc finger protein 543-like n=1 Tax=Melanerpes formicivorus TaxID=211600 RepID=UPI00359005AE
MPPGGEQGKRRDERGLPGGSGNLSAGSGDPRQEAKPPRRREMIPGEDRGAPAVVSRSAMAGQRQVPVTFEDVAVYLSRAEWEAISEEQQELYRSVMLDVCELLRSLGIQAEPPLGTEQEMFGGHHPGSRQEEVSQQPTDRDAVPEVIVKVEPEGELCRRRLHGSGDPEGPGLGAGAGEPWRDRRRGVSQRAGLGAREGFSPGTWPPGAGHPT